MATPRLIGPKILRISLVILAFGGCKTKEATPPPEAAPQTTLQATPGAGPGLEALAQYYEQAHQAKSEASPAPVAGDQAKPMGKETTVGKILMVNEASRFVLIDTKTGRRPPEGSTVISKGDIGTKTSSLRVSKEQRREFLSADIVEGTPSVGELVLWKR